MLNENACLKKGSVSKDGITLIGREDKNIKVAFNIKAMSNYKLGQFVKETEKTIKDATDNKKHYENIIPRYEWVISPGSSNPKTLRQGDKGPLSFVFKGDSVSSEYKIEAKSDVIVKNQVDKTERKINSHNSDFIVNIDLRDNL